MSTIIVFMVQVVGISLSGVMAPGPITAATIVAGTRSRHAGGLIALGHALVEFPLVFGILLGMDRLLESETTKMIIGLAGGAFLLWMGGQMLCSLNKGSNNITSYNSRNPFWIGVILSATNPYFLLWWATVGLALAKDARDLSMMVFVLFTIVHWLCDLVWLEVLSWTSSKGSKLVGEHNLRRILIICSITLLFFGATFIYRAFYIKQ